MTTLGSALSADLAESEGRSANIAPNLGSPTVLAPVPRHTLLKVLSHVQVLPVHRA